MKKLTLYLGWAFALAVTSVHADKLEFGEGFKANLTIDSAFTTDHKTYKISASGEAAPIGKIYLSYVFTDKMGLGDRGEFTGTAWAQKGEAIRTATLQGVVRKEGSVFKMYSLDLVSDKTINMALGTVNFVDKTMSFEVMEIK